MLSRLREVMAAACARASLEVKRGNSLVSPKMKWFCVNGSSEASM
jgi:hypothetical protein